MLKPEDIEAKTFTVRHIRGYDPQEVDDFLDAVKSDYEAALAQLRTVNVEASRLRQAPTQVLAQSVPAATDPIGGAARLLDMAQKAADQQAEDAKRAAALAIADAKAAGEKVLADARAQAEQIVAEGNSRRHEIVGELELKRTELQNKVDALVGQHSEVKDKLAAALNALS